MQVKQLLAYLADKNPDMEVVVRGEDHSYMKAYVSTEVAVYEEPKKLTEYDGKHGSPVGVLVIY